MKERRSMVSAKACLRRPQRGFTLLELLVALVVVALLAVWAVPNLRGFVLDTRITTNTNSLVAHLNYARSEAITRQVPVCVCASDDTATCTGTDWHLGWIIFTDEGTACAVDGGDTILRKQAELDDGITLSVTKTSLQFLPSGMLASICQYCRELYLAREDSHSPGYWVGRVLSALVPAARADDDDSGDQDSGDDDSGDDNGSEDDDNGDQDSGDGGGNKISICHTPPVGGDNPQTITISESAWTAHESHGDTQGACDDGDDNGNNGGGSSSFTGGPATFTMCIDGQTDGHTISVNAMGRTRVDAASCN